MRALFVTNGNGEMAIADRIAQELQSIAPGCSLDHLALVGDVRSQFMRDVGPRGTMPSGGLIAMGQVKNMVRDLRGGLLALTLAQRRFLVASRGDYERVVAVGDVYALIMALAAHAPTTYVGTAKSVSVARYGAMECRVLRRAQHVLVRDEPTARDLARRGVDAQSPGNVIVDLFATLDDPRADLAVAGFDPVLALLPGSRGPAYADAVFLAEVLRAVARSYPRLGGALSIAPQLDARRMEWELAATWTIERGTQGPVSFALRDGERTLVRAWNGALGPLLRRTTLVVGQAGTANEAAAAAGIPIVAFERAAHRKAAWYRMRQSGLLGDALMVLPGDVPSAATGVARLLDDEAAIRRMGAAGRALMGAPGGARRIACIIAGIPKE